MLNIQCYLRCTPKGVDPFTRLQSELGVYSKRHPKFPNLVQFTYDTIEASSAELRVNPIVRECRGLILDEAEDWNVIAHPFHRFFNAEEPCADYINWQMARVQEKVDGSLMIVYHYDGAWQVATRGSPDAGGNVSISTRVFNEYFWETFHRYDPNNDLVQDTTYLFEFTSPESRIVCEHAKSDITLLSIRDMLGREYPLGYDLFDMKRFPIVAEFPLTSLEECYAAAKALNPIQQEGFVVVDNFFHRVKIKSPSYVAIHHIKDGFGKRRLVELIKNGEKSEVLAYFPEYLKLFEEVSLKLDSIIVNTEKRYEEIKHLAVGKEFALEAVTSPMSSAMFAVKRGKVNSVREFIMGMATDKLADLL